MYIEQLNTNWSREPIFASGYSPIGTSYFCHLLYKDELVGTARVELVGDNEWAAMIENGDDVIHQMGETYSDYREAIEDVIGWYIGQ